MIGLKRIFGMGGRRRSAAGYRYYRLNITSGNGGAGPQIGEWQIRVSSTDQIPTMTGATTSGVTMSADHEHSAPFLAWKAGDDDDATFWDADNAGVSVIKVDFGAGGGFEHDDYTVKAAPGGQSAFAPNSWTFEGSNDDSNWTVLDTVSGETSWGSSEERTFS